MGGENYGRKLLTYRRIKEVLINSEFSWWKDDYQEFYFNLNKSRMAQADILPIDLFASIRPVFGKDIYAGTIVVDNETEKAKTFFSPIKGVRYLEYAICTSNHP